MRTLSDECHLVSLENEIEKIKWDITGISEMRRPGENVVERASQHIMFNKGNDKKQGGVGFLIHKKLKGNIEEFHATSNRVASVTIRISKRYKIRIIQVYAPTSVSSQEELEEFYDDLQTEMRHKKTHYNVIMGDFNAKVGKGDEDCVGSFGYGVRNDRGDDLINFATAHGFKIMNTYYKKKKNRRWTWRSPNFETFNEIDYVLVDKNNIVKNFEVLNKVNVDSDHRMIRCKVQIDSKQERKRLEEHLDGHWDHRRNTHILWKTINGLSNKKPTPISNNTITFKNYTAITPKQQTNQFTKQFTNITKHKTKTHYRKIHRKIESLPTTPIKITIAQTSAALKSTKNTNSTGPDGLNIRHLKHLGPKGLDYLTKILNLSLNKNIIPQIWKLAKIIPIPKPNKDPHQGSSYRPISLLSPTAKLLEKIILPYITNIIPSIYHQHGFKTKHSTTTALHQLTNHITTGFNQKKPPHRTITIALDMSQAFDTVNHYTLIEKLINTNTPNLITRFITNYIRGRKAFTQYKNKNSFKKQFKAGVPQGGVLSPTLFNIYMSDLPTPPRDIHVTTYADDITIYSSDKNYTIAQQRLQPYLEDVQTWTKANNLKLNASKTMTTLFTPDPAEYRDELSLQLDNTRLPTIRNPKILGLTFDPKLTFNEHIKTSKDKAEKTINILKALTSTHWGKNKETLTNTYKTVTRPILEYAGTIYAPIISDKQLTALQVTQNQGLRIATGCTSDTNINHIHDETKILPIEKHLRLHSSQLRQKASHPDHPLHRLTTQPQPPRLKKKTIFNNNQYTLNIDPDPTHAIDENTIKRNMKTIHTTIVQDHLSNRPINKLLNRPPPDIDKKEETLPHSTRRKLSQLRTNKSPLLMTYLHKIDPANHPAANCPLCNDPNHDSLHLFNCPDIPTTLTVWDLWTDPVGVAALLDVWGEKLGGPRAGV